MKQTHREGTILQRLEAAVTRGPKLYHATRVLVGVIPKLPPKGTTTPRWCSGIAPDDSWKEFLGERSVVEAQEYERRSRWQHSCYYGATESMNDYTLLAAEACELLPPQFAIPRDFSRRLHVDRDVWSFFLYRLASENEAAFGLDIYSIPPYSDLAFPGLESVVACLRENRDQEEPMLARFRNGYKQSTGRMPKFVYATLRLDVFSASVLGVRYLVENQDRLYSPGTLAEVGLIPAVQAPPATSSTLPVAGTDNKETGPKASRASGQNEERDRWIYAQCMKRMPYATIREGLAKRPDWEVLCSDQGVHQAARRYVKRHRLAPLPKRKGDEG